MIYIPVDIVLSILLIYLVSFFLCIVTFDNIVIEYLLRKYGPNKAYSLYGHLILIPVLNTIISILIVSDLVVNKLK